VWVPQLKENTIHLGVHSGIIRDSCTTYKLCMLRAFIVDVHVLPRRKQVQGSFGRKQVQGSFGRKQVQGSFGRKQVQGSFGFARCVTSSFSIHDSTLRKWRACAAITVTRRCSRGKVSQVHCALHSHEIKVMWCKDTSQLLTGSAKAESAPNSPPN
jgi:hypothetical protein